MKSRLVFQVMILLMVALVAGFGCSKSKPVTPGMTGGVGGSGAFTEAELREAAAEISENRIYFGFDRYDLNNEAKSILNRKAELLKRYPQMQVLISGNCDERGTEEYNLALGERRARAAYEYLVLMGVSSGQLQTVSYGKARPIDPGHNEQAWSMNRRDDFAVTNSY